VASGGLTIYYAYTILKNIVAQEKSARAAKRDKDN